MVSDGSHLIDNIKQRSRETKHAITYNVWVVSNSICLENAMQNLVADCLKICFGGLVGSLKQRPMCNGM